MKFRLSVITCFGLNRKVFYCTMDQSYNKKNLIKLYLESVAAVNPAKLISDNLKITKNKLLAGSCEYDIVNKNIYVVGFGKAVLGMAAECEKILGKRLKSGVICAPKNIRSSIVKNFEVTTKKDSVVVVHEGAENNLPDEDAVAATNEIISLVETLKEEKDHLIVLISGGGSALFTKPKPGISLEEKRATVKLLMEAGADINELNTVRQQLSAVKGGGLASLSHSVPTTCFIISDVISDPLEIIASGPTVSPSNLNSPLDILQKYGLKEKIPISVLQEITKPFQQSNIQIKNCNFVHVKNFLIGNNQKALDAAGQYADKSGLKSVILSNQVKGNIQTVSHFYTQMIFQILLALFNRKNLNSDFLKYCDFNVKNSIVDEINKIIKNTEEFKNICIIAGGETTVKVKGDGKGGRNQELGLITSLNVYNLKQEHPNLFEKFDVQFLFAGTDGQDGPTDAAGALGGSDLIEAAEKLNINFYEYLERNDSYNFFSKMNDGFLIKIGYTGTNVMDIHTILISVK